MNRLLKMITLLFAFTLNSCGLINYYKITKVKQSSYSSKPIANKSFAFEMINNRMVVPVYIQGKQYYFLFDTGAGLVVDKQLLNEIKSDNIAKIKIIDANDRSNKLKYVKIAEIESFGIQFKQQGAIVMDLSEPVRNSCVQVSGIFGASLMKGLIWQINFQNQTISVSNNLTNSNIDKDNWKIPFTTNPSSAPLVEAKINGIHEKLMIDTGSGGTIILAKTKLDSLTSNEKITSIGRFGGVFGSTIDTVYSCREKVKFNQSIEKDWDGVIEIRKNLEEGRIGLGFLKDYLVTIDWKDQHIYLKAIENGNKIWESYGFHLGKYKQNIEISKVDINSKAYKSGLRVGDIIREIDDFNFINATENDICNFILKDYLNSVDSDIIIKIKERKDPVFLSKELLFVN